MIEQAESSERVMDDEQQGDEEMRPQDGAPANGLPSNGSPAADSPEGEHASDDAPPPPADQPKRPSTLESWLAAAEASKKEKPKPQAAGKRDWYILKVQSNREDSIRDALLKRIRIQGLEDFFGEIIVPIEKVTEFKNGKKRVVKRKLYPGYIVLNMELNDDTWFLVRETGGIGDFTGSGGKPTPMAAADVAKIINKPEEQADEAPKLKINFNKADRVKINEGMFENFEGEVESIDEQNGRVTVMINIFGRSTPVELEYWQLEAL